VPTLQLAQLIEAAKEKGYILFEEIEARLPEDYIAGREMAILSEFEKAGIEVIEPAAAIEIEPPIADLVDDPFAVYLREVNAVPPLTRQGEADLARRIQRGGEEAERARKDLVEANLRIVVSIAKHRGGGDIYILDLIQEGNEGLLKAARQFDFASRCKFATYATWLVRRALSRHSIQRL
jgi:RNA polymerase primary sigma factor